METHPIEVNKKWLYTFTAFTGNSNISASLHNSFNFWQSKLAMSTGFP